MSAADRTHTQTLTHTHTQTNTHAHFSTHGNQHLRLQHLTTWVVAIQYLVLAKHLVQHDDFPEGITVANCGTPIHCKNVVQVIPAHVKIPLDLIYCKICDP